MIPLGNTTEENNAAANYCVEYCGNYIYSRNGTGSFKLSRIITSEGYIETNEYPLSYNTLWNYVYNIKDHQNNTRVTLICDKFLYNSPAAYSPSAQTDYYPFGLEHSTSPQTNGNILNSGTNPYLYSGKELDRMNGLNMYDFNARWLDNAVPVFTTFDPLAEFRASESPYSYCGGDPVNRMDPTGLMWWKNKYSSLNITCTTNDSPPDNTGDWLELGREFFLKNGEDENYIYGDLCSYNCQVIPGLVIDKPKQYNFSPEFQNQTLYQASNILGYDFLIGKKIITINELLGDLTIDLRKLGLNVVNPLNPVLSKPFPLKPMSDAEIAKFEQKLQDERNKSPYRKAWDETVNSVTGTLSSWGNDLSSVEWWKYNAPAWGDANRAADAFNSGQYLASAGHVLMGVANLAMVGELATGIGNTVRNAVIKESVAKETKIQVEQYTLRAAENGFYPVMKRGFKNPQELIWLNKDEIWKIGTTKNPLTRYSQRYLDNIGEYGVYYYKEFSGTLQQSLQLERMKIINFLDQIGILPAGNKIIK